MTTVNDFSMGPFAGRRNMKSAGVRLGILVAALGGPWLAGCVGGDGDPSTVTIARQALTASVEGGGGSGGGGGGSGGSGGSSGETPAQKLARLRAEIAAKGYTFTVGFNEAFFRPLSELAGTVAPPDIADIVRRQNGGGGPPVPTVTAASTIAAAVACSTSAASFDWRPANIVTPVGNQGGCGSCWDFATLGAFEGAYAIKNPINLRIRWESITNFRTSNQDVLSCSGAGTCAGGWYAFDFVLGGGVARATRYPYTATDSACDATRSRPTPSPVAPIGGTFRYLSEVIDPGFNSQRVPTDAEIKTALCQFGPLSTTALVTDLFGGYTGGVFNEVVDDAILHPVQPDGLKAFNVNHGIVIIGWDDATNTWTIKNSWGTTWGETGFMRITRTSNNIGWMTVSVDPVAGR
jgi:cathepsin L